MDIITACRTVNEARGDSVLVATMGAMGAFDQLGVGQPRISSVPLMGGAASLGLGLAIAQESRRIVVVDGDASLLMQLGVLATVADRGPENLYHFVVSNGTQFSGFANLAIPVKGVIDFPAMAKAAGYRDGYRFDSEASLAGALSEIFSRKGPILVELVVEPGQEKPGVPTMMEIPDFQFVRMGSEARALEQWLVENTDG